MDNRQCIACKQTKPISEFHFSNGYPRSRCKPCRNEQNSKWNRLHAGEYGEWQKDYRSHPGVKARRNRRERERYASDPDFRAKLLLRNRDNNYRMRLKTTYGLTIEEYISLVEAQGGLCAICRCDITSLGTRRDGNTYHRAHVDHDHVTGRIRGILCPECNVGLGKFIDKPDVLRAAADYLERQ